MDTQTQATPKKEREKSKDYLVGIESFTEQEKLFVEKTRGSTFEQLYNKYYEKLMFYISKFFPGGDDERVQDITTDTFLRAFKKIETYDFEKGEFSTWLFTIGRNLATQELHSKKKVVSMDVEMDENGSTIKDFIAENVNDNSTQQSYELTGKKYEVMLQAIEELKPSYREIIKMREFDKKSYQVITEELGLLLSTTKSRIRSARMKLVEIVDRKFKELEDMYE